MTDTVISEAPELSVKNEEKKSKRLKINRLFTKPGISPFNEVEWTTSKVEITNVDNEVFFNMDVEHPIFWDSLAVRICADKYFKVRDLENHPHGGERSIRDLLHRVAYGISQRAKNLDYIDEESRDIFYNELCYIMLHQLAAFNSPVFFNMGLFDVYGFEGNSGIKRYGIKDRDGEIFEHNSEYEFPQTSACFLTKVDDELISDETGIYDWIKTEMSIFANGSGSGTNVSNIRGKDEPITGGGKSSGLIPFLEVANTSAGAIKSGGKTRRAACLRALDDTHPDLLDFIDWKKNEEAKARALILNGYMQNYSHEDGAYATVQGQNGNNSINISNKFLEAVVNDDDWDLKYVLTGKTKVKLKARDIFDKIIDAAWECGDPGLIFSETVNGWHTIPNTGPIKTSNPCGEIFSTPGNSCSLASPNLIKFLNNDKTFNLESYRHVIELLLTSIETMIGSSSFPARYIAEMTKNTRPAGIGYCNMGGLIMALGYPYDSEHARSIIANISSYQTAVAYTQSARIANVVGPFNDYAKNKSEFNRVIKRHAECNNDLKPKVKFTKLIQQASADAWNDVVNLIAKYGCRNSQVTAIAPTGTISLFLGTSNNGIEPPFSLISHKITSDGSFMTLVCDEVKLGLKEIGYNERQMDEIFQYINKNGVIQGAPYVNPAHYNIFDTASSIRPIAHIDAVAAAQQFISGGISKTINMPEEATKQDIYNCYMEAWRKGCKGITIYRNNSKWSQPLNAVDSTVRKQVIQKEVERTKARLAMSDFYKKNANDVWNYNRGLLTRKRAADRAPAERFMFRVGGENVWINVVRFPDNGISELWVEVGKENPTINGLADTIGRICSVSIQYGVPIDALCETMLGLQFSPSGFLGKNDLDIKHAKSLPDLLAKTLKSLDVEYNNNTEQQVVSTVMIDNQEEDFEVMSEADQAKSKGFSGVRCDTCGSWKCQGTIKCGVCLSCQTAYGTCSG